MNIKLLITLSILSSSYFCFGQYNSIFGENSTKYLIFETISDGSEVNEHISSSTIEDEGKIYHVFPTFLVREDVTTGKIWKRSSLTTDEILIMDMSLELGDTMHLSQSDFYNIYYEQVEQEYAIVQNVFYNQYGKNISLDCHTNNPLIYQFAEDESVPLKFIEGIGPNFGYCYGSFIYPADTYLVCSYKDDTLSYVNTEFETCDSTIFWIVGSNSVNTNEISKFHCFPNPNNGNFEISCPVYFTGNIKILDLKGNILYNGHIINQKSIKLNLPYLSRGIYSLVLEYNNKQEVIKLIII